ncbi:MFS transporter [Wenzhouxiangella sp. XN24]|uniref:MFS transporter n=1 Tax=Wenzhouxiangella sp. XN24 TaxID=2713569 RepID=UPI0013EC44B6|nr:MFS transporter [Wenzhouxiangella sp. XN24]NGX17203.1 MFS transporter [Wenzhouxiangella sp. XN24]
MAATLVLADSSRVRFLSSSSMYFAQGIPQGFLSIAIPAWLASLGVSAGDIASYLAVIVLPWAFKLVAGPFMDRFEFLPMGRRRPWVLGAQLGLTLSFLALTLVRQPDEQMGLLMLIGVLINSFAATQDVAVDGMAIDLTPVNEQGRLNAFMSFGKAIGWAGTAAVSGVLLATAGMAVTALVASAVSGVLLLAFVFVLERPGERVLPWSAGKAGSRHQPGNSFRAVFAGLNAVLWTRASVVVMAIMLFDGLVSGYGHALMPVAAVNLFGYTAPQWSQLVAIMGLVGAVAALSLGPMIDRFGVKRMLILTTAVVGVHAFMLAQTQFMWENSAYIRVMLSAWVLMSPVVMVCVIALAMTVCSSAASATQFAIYMSTANLGAAAGSKLFGLLSERSDYAEIYMLLGALIVVLLFIMLLHRADGGGEKERKGPRRYTVGSVGAEAGIFWSGAMRCPKCRSDMQPVNYEGVELDRCNSCRGLWFDAGEVEALAGTQAAAAIDIGDARAGKRLNAVDDYRCPRCGGAMARRVDPQQRHIWYESCIACEGSFFDAGEFRDLAQLTIADFFKRLVTPRRKNTG